MWYEIDFRRLVILLLPIRLRKAKTIAFIQALLAPVEDIHYRFKQKRLQDWFMLNHNSQVCYLERALNTTFDSTERRIKIVDGSHYSKEYIYTRQEEKPRYLGTIYLHDRSVYSENGPDFIVQVPQGLEYDEYQMKALIEQFKLATKTYKIQEV